MWLQMETRLLKVSFSYLRINCTDSRRQLKTTSGFSLSHGSMLKYNYFTEFHTRAAAIGDPS